MKHEHVKLAVTMPAHNEEPTIARVVAGVPRDIPGIDEVEVFVINDASTDRTAELAEAEGATVVTVTGRPGLGSIFRIGMDRAMRSGANYIVNIDSDGQFNPDDIRKLVAPLLDDQADFVTCSRFATPEVIPEMPGVKLWGNKLMCNIINYICGGTGFTDVSCGFRALNREAAYRMTLFGRFTYTQECFIDLYNKGCRIAEVPIKIRGTREFGESRVARNVWRYGINALEVILRAARDIRPLRFFGGGALLLTVPGLIGALFVSMWYLITGRTSPWTSLIGISGTLLTLAIVFGAIALLADMLSRHRRISEELLYLTRKRVYANARTMRAAHVDDDAIGPVSLHDLPADQRQPVMKQIADAVSEKMSTNVADRVIEKMSAR